MCVKRLVIKFSNRSLNQESTYIFFLEKLIILIHEKMNANFINKNFFRLKCFLTLYILYSSIK